MLKEGREGNDKKDPFLNEINTSSVIESKSTDPS